MSKRDRLLGLRLNDEEWDALTHESERTSESRQRFIRQLLRRALRLPTACEAPVH